MKPNVLLVDDEPDLTSALAWSLQREGLEVRVVHTGRDGLRKARQEPPPDLVLLDLSLDDRHRITAVSVLARKSDASARVYEGHNRDVGADVRVTRSRWVERQLLYEQLSGSHRLPGDRDLTVDWRYALAIATRLEPDRRETRFDNEPGTHQWRLSDRPEDNQIVYSDLRDVNHDGGLGVRWVIADPVTIQAGASAMVKDREVDTRRFKYPHKGPVSRDQDLLYRDAADIWTQDTIGPDGFQSEEITRQTDNDFASQDLQAGFAQATLHLPLALDLVGGHPQR